ncbi:hypothetical protein HLY00_830 [Mycolicibacterium hippocampi]|uniref:Uncharacterized protein n=1 Tax=Mycolicibacterium hippocampi TaxID=659824 RepID=A0A850PUN4_9MYCO|nr:hypothetical protein [Mycolicibacterium hippocampi]
MRAGIGNWGSRTGQIRVPFPENWGAGGYAAQRSGLRRADIARRHQAHTHQETT